MSTTRNIRQKILSQPSLQKPKRIAKRILRIPHGPLTQESVAEARSYIRHYWQKLLVEHTDDEGTVIGLPFPYIVPSKGEGEFTFGEQYYWDSFFTVLGLRSAEDQSLVEGMLENLLYLYRRFGIIPNASRMYLVGRSQPPMLTSFIFFIYDTFDKSEDWLRERINIAHNEYESVWVSKRHPTWHNVHQGLSRYYDVNVMHDMAEMESGWDMTTRFSRKCLDFLPIDLNCLLYKYETDFARAAEILGDTESQQKWLDIADKRKAAVDKLMWSKLRGFYFDYNYQRKAQGEVWSLAAYFALWSGIASEAQAKRLVANLIKFEKRGGLSTTIRPIIDQNLFGSLRTQWAYPNGWAPLHYVAVKGLRNYGYEAEARRIALKWIRTNNNWFLRHGEFLEKYNVINPKRPPMEGVYPKQVGFGWTNAIFERFCIEYLDKAKKDQS